MGCFIPFISVFYIIGFWMLGYGLWAARQSMQAAAWPVTSATITKLEFLESSGHDHDRFEVKVQYSYIVGDRTYEGSRIAFGYAGSSDRESQDEIHRKLSKATTVSVRYNPSEPSVSCLSFGLHSSIQFLLVFAVTWLLFIFGITVLALLGHQRDVVLLDNLSVQ